MASIDFQFMMLTICGVRALAPGLHIRAVARCTRLDVTIWLVVLISVATTVVPPPALPATIALDSLVGVMQQPTSNYYLGTYGASLGIWTASEALGAKVSYLERPLAKSSGYEDMDRMASLQLATLATADRSMGRILAGFGAAEVRGFTRGGVTSAGRSGSYYRLRGPTASLEYAVRIGRLELGICHQSILGLVDREQVQALVGWPYSLYLVRVGARL